MCSHYFCMFCAVSDIPSTQSTPNKHKRKGSALGLDPEDLAIRSPRQRSCKRLSPLPLPAKQVQRCVKELLSVLVVCACMHFPELELMPCTQFDFSKEDWSCEITCVDLGWRIEKCSSFSLELNKEGLFSDEVPFVLTTHAPPSNPYPLIWLEIAFYGTSLQFPVFATF